MSLYTVKELDDIDVRVYFKNTLLYGIQEDNIFADDNKVDAETGRVYKFSVFDQECNLFRFPANKFLPRLEVGARIYKDNKCMLFGQPKFRRARPNLDGSHETLEERGLCQC